MSEFKRYRKAAIAEMRPYVPDEDLRGISISPEDRCLSTLEGGMVARNPNNHAEQWYVAGTFFRENYILLEEEKEESELEIEEEEEEENEIDWEDEDEESEDA